jgi:hypothetical protein
VWSLSVIPSGVVIPSVERGISDRGIPFDIHYIQLYIHYQIALLSFFLSGLFLFYCHSECTRVVVVTVRPPAGGVKCERRARYRRSRSLRSHLRYRLHCAVRPPAGGVKCERRARNRRYRYILILRHTGRKNLMLSVSQPVRARFVSVAKGSFIIVFMVFPALYTYSLHLY